MKIHLKRLLCILGAGEDDVPLLDLLCDLPLELSIHILRMLDASSLFDASLVSKRWLSLVRSDSLLVSRMREENWRRKRERMRGYFNSTLHLPLTKKDRIYRFTSIRCEVCYEMSWHNKLSRNGILDAEFPSTFRTLDHELHDNPGRSTVISSRKKRHSKAKDVLRVLGGVPVDSSMNEFDAGVGAFYSNPMFYSP